MKENLDTPLFNERSLSYWYSPDFPQKEVVEQIVLTKRKMETAEPSKRITILDAMIAYNSLEDIFLPKFSESGEELEEIATKIEKILSKEKKKGSGKMMGRKGVSTAETIQKPSEFLFDNATSASKKPIKGMH